MVNINWTEMVTDMTNYDKDKRYMAASDICQEIINCEKLPEIQTQKKICGAFVAQLQDASIDVQGNAVKCLSKMVCKFQDSQMEEVLRNLSQLVLDGKPEVRDIYSTCLKGLILEMPNSKSDLLCTNIVPT
eukprot:GHVR01020436.1.p1 GENE.GHVR01020436.1~~GHVR01020436.1.p1  ORF type:complete len:131 (+),score=12.25 GHVR01020436.1:114-506(+)